MPFRPMSLRGQRVLARCTPDGSLVAEGGRVEIRYSPRDGKAYHAALRNLEPVAGDARLLADEEVASVKASPAAGAGAAAKKAGKTTRSAGNAGSAGGAAPTKPAAGEVLAYCDGACSGNPGPAGVGVILLYDDVRWELSEYLGQATNNIGELTGILRACEQMPDAGRPLRIYTDSTYAIGVLQGGWKAKANQELIAQCKAALRGLSEVTLHHVRGHAGVPLNEAADVLAVSAVERRRSTPWTKVSGG